MENQLHVGKTKPSKEMMSPIKNKLAFYKPYGGIWTSTFDGTIGSDWLRWCHQNDWYDKDYITAWLLVPESDVNVFVIDSYADLEEFAEKYSTPFEDLNIVRNYDFERMMQDYDGLHVTERGLMETHLSMPLSLHGYDCESTIWFKWKFENVQSVKLKQEDWGFVYVGAN